MTGFFKKVNEKGFGFIEGEDGQDYFCHRSSFKGKWMQLIEEVEGGHQVPVSFDAGESTKGKRAENVRLL